MKEDLIYHYTSAEGLVGILDKQHVRMTNVKYLNDSKELIHGTELAKSHLSEAIEELKTKNQKISKLAEILSQSPTAFQRLSLLANSQAPRPVEPTFPPEYRFTGGVFGQLTDWIDTLTQTAPFYTASFCKKGNILRQWMAYCPEGGYAIGLNLSKLKIHCKGNANLDIQPVDYLGGTEFLKRRLKKIKNIAYQYSSILNLLIEQYPASEDLFASKEYKNGSDSLSSQIKHQAYLIARASLAKKERYFQDEEEVRLVMTNLSSRNLLTENLSIIDFVPKNNLLVPYIPFNFPIEALENIYVGPMQNQRLACESLAKLRSKEGYKFTIERSEIPLRRL